MTSKITCDVLESYLYCKYKGWLKLSGQEGTKSDYERLLNQSRAEVRLLAIDKILAQHSHHEVARQVLLDCQWALKTSQSWALENQPS